MSLSTVQGLGPIVPSPEASQNAVKASGLGDPKIPNPISLHSEPSNSSPPIAIKASEGEQKQSMEAELKLRESLKAQIRLFDESYWKQKGYEVEYTPIPPDILEAVNKHATLNTLFNRKDPTKISKEYVLIHKPKEVTLPALIKTENIIYDNNALAGLPAATEANSYWFLMPTKYAMPNVQGVVYGDLSLTKGWVELPQIDKVLGDFTIGTHLEYLMGVLACLDIKPKFFNNCTFVCQEKVQGKPIIIKVTNGKVGIELSQEATPKVAPVWSFKGLSQRVMEVASLNQPQAMTVLASLEAEGPLLAERRKEREAERVAKEREVKEQADVARIKRGLGVDPITQENIVQFSTEDEDRATWVASVICHYFPKLMGQTPPNKFMTLSDEEFRKNPDFKPGLEDISYSNLLYRTVVIVKLSKDKFLMVGSDNQNYNTDLKLPKAVILKLTKELILQSGEVFSTFEAVQAQVNQNRLSCLDYYYKKADVKTGTESAVSEGRPSKTKPFQNIVRRFDPSITESFEDFIYTTYDYSTKSRGINCGPRKIYAFENEAVLSVVPADESSAEREHRLTLLRELRKRKLEGEYALSQHEQEVLAKYVSLKSIEPVELRYIAHKLLKDFYDFMWVHPLTAERMEIDSFLCWVMDNIDPQVDDLIVATNKMDKKSAELLQSMPEDFGSRLVGPFDETMRQYQKRLNYHELLNILQQFLVASGVQKLVISYFVY